MDNDFARAGAPDEMSEALAGYARVAPEIPRADAPPFNPWTADAHRAAYVPEDFDDAECFRALAPLEKLFAPPAEIATAAALFAGYHAEPIYVPLEDFSPEERLLNENPLERIWRDAVIAAAAQPETSERPRFQFTREGITPPAKTDAPERTVKFRDSHGTIWREEFDASGILQSAQIIEDADEIDKARRDSSFEKRDEVLAKDETGNVESISEMLISAFENLDGQGADESDEDFCERLSAELERLGMRPPLSRN
jgi:hypothetical protein